MSQVTSALKNVPFENVIGGPLIAAVKAQAMAANSTVEFIQAVGFKKKIENQEDFSGFDDSATEDTDSGEVRNVTFSYDVSDASDGGEARTAKLVVPILTIVPIPYIRIEEMTIDFNFKVSEQTSAKKVATTSSGSSANFSASARYWGVKASFSGSYTSKKSQVNTSDRRYKEEATVDVHVRAVQDEMPAGLTRILSILESSIRDERPEPAVEPPAIADADKIKSKENKENKEKPPFSG